MFLNYKVYLKYILNNTKYAFINHVTKNSKTTTIFLNQNQLFFVVLHVKLTSNFFSSQLIDMFAYEVTNTNFWKSTAPDLKPRAYLNEPITVYNFNLIFNNQRLLILTFNKNLINAKSAKIKKKFTNSINELYLNSNWLEREIFELHGIFFYFKKDLRNLLLPYGDNSIPMKKIYPSIGTREIFYNAGTDTLIQTPISIQF